MRVLAVPAGRPADLLLAGALIVLGGAAFARPLAWLWTEWQNNDYYQHGPLVPPTSAVLAYLALARREPASARGEGGRAAPWLALAAAGCAVRLAAAALASDFLGAVALVPALLGGVGYLAGGRVGRALAFPVAFLLVAVPLPFMDDLGFYFQRLSSAGAAAVLVRAGVPATYQGAELSLPGASFIVGTPCSGLYSTVALAALGMLYARMLDFPSRLQVAALLGLLVPLGLATNVVRLGSLLGVAYLWGPDVAMAYYHNALGIVFWALALALLVASGKGVRWIASRAAA